MQYIRKVKPDFALDLCIRLDEFQLTLRLGWFGLSLHLNSVNYASLARETGVKVYWKHNRYVRQGDKYFLREKQWIKRRVPRSVWR